MKKLLGIWRAMTGAERVVAAAALLALASCPVFAAAALLERPGDILNPDAAFDSKQGPGKKSNKKPTAKDRTVDWPQLGYDVGRSKFLDAQNVRPPFQRLWKYDGGELIEFPPIVVDDRLYFIDNDGALRRARRRDRQDRLEEAHLAALNASSPAYDDGVLYSVSLEPGQAIAVRAKDGKVLWRKELGAGAESSPMVVRGRMYFGDEGGQFYALDAKDGSTIWQTSLGGSVKAAPALDDGTLFVGDYGGNMNAVRASDGELLWQTPDLGTGVGSGRIYSTAAVAFGRVYAGDVDNRVYSYEEETGEIAWTFSAGDYVYSGDRRGRHRVDQARRLLRLPRPQHLRARREERRADLVGVGRRPDQRAGDRRRRRRLRLHLQRQLDARLRPELRAERVLLRRRRVRPGRLRRREALPDRRQHRDRLPAVRRGRVQVQDQGGPEG